MGYEIIYDRRFIKVETGVGARYIPIIQHGSNNCTEYSYTSGREVSEKHWSVSNYPERGKYLFNEAGIEKLASKQMTFENFKSRNRKFSPEEYYRWFVNGIKHAETVEYYMEHWNRLKYMFEKLINAIIFLPRKICYKN